MGGGPDRQLADLPRLDRRRQAGFDQAEPVGGADLAPAVPAEHRRGVVEGDLAQLGLGALVEEGLDPGLHRLDRAVQVGVEDDVGDPFGRLRLEPFVDRLQELGLAAEVVVERTAGDAGLAHDLLGRDSVVAPLGEEPAGSGDQRVASRLRALGLGVRLLTFILYVYYQCPTSEFREEP